MKRLSFLFKDVKEYNKYLLSILAIFIILFAGIISYNYTNSSYAKWSSGSASNNTIKVGVKIIEYVPILNILVGTDGIEKVTHTIDDTLQVDESFAVEYRYRGGNVNNYVTFNNETWRIIGVLPTEDTDGNVEYRLKIIRDESIGNYTWDSDTEIAYNYSNNDSIKLLESYNTNSNNIDDLTDYNITKTGISIDKVAVVGRSCSNCGNNWARPSVLNTYLNGTYYNSLSSESQSMIGTVKYYLGGGGSLTSKMWQYERKNDANRSGYYFKTNPVVQSDASKKIALMYASDYGYAASTSCSDLLFNFSDDSNCITVNNWLDKSQYEWLLPQGVTLPYETFIINDEGNLKGGSSTYVFDSRATRPVLYLSSNVVISGGTGTSSDPYTLSM